MSKSRTSPLWRDAIRDSFLRGGDVAETVFFPKFLGNVLLATRNIVSLFTGGYTGRERVQRLGNPCAACLSFKSARSLINRFSSAGRNVS